jgi:high-affinity Fe2+/Pb2+ permease
VTDAPDPQRPIRAANASPPRALVAVTAVILAGYLGVVVWAWASPSTDPQRGMAEGFLMLVTLFLLLLAGLLWLGAARGHRKLVWTVFGICVFPSLSLVARGIYLLVRWIQGS